MSKITQLFAYDVPKLSYIEGSPCRIVPCPYCKRFHVLQSDAEYVKLTCTSNPMRPGYARIIGGGPAIRPLLGAFISGKPLPDASELWELQPRELWREVEEIADEVAAKLEAVDLE